MGQQEGGFPITRVRRTSLGTTSETETAHVGYVFVLNLITDDPQAPLSEARATIRPIPVLSVPR